MDIYSIIIQSLFNHHSNIIQSSFNHHSINHHSMICTCTSRCLLWAEGAGRLYQRNLQRVLTANACGDRDRGRGRDIDRDRDRGRDRGRGRDRNRDRDSSRKRYLGIYRHIYIYMRHEMT
jgi:hypothetical protein